MTLQESIIDVIENPILDLTDQEGAEIFFDALNESVEELKQQ